MATPEDVLAYLSGRYRKQVKTTDKMSEVVAPIPIGSEAPVLAGLLGARFSSRITGAFIARSNRTADEVCNETILRRRQTRAEARAARLSALTDGMLSRIETPTLPEEENEVVADELVHLFRNPRD